MKKTLYLICLIGLLCCLPQTGSADVVTVTVKPGETTGKIRPLHGVNSPPTRRIVKWFEAAGIPFMRGHDTEETPGTYGYHSFDVAAIFGDFSADVNDPAAYDFNSTDELIGRTLSAGTKVFFRLGETIEHGTKKYDIYPPKDYLKWAQICEHIIRHYNEGWAEGFRYGIEYWEIWNEADADKNGRWKENPRTWGGPEEEFYAFYATVSKHLKKCFPHLKIGGPAMANPTDEKWLNGFLSTAAKAKAPIDFFSWHAYRSKPELVVECSDIVDKALKRYGYGDAETILSEWNYVIQWKGETFYESAQARYSGKGAAYIASTLISCQNSTSLQKMMYYEFRPDWNKYCQAFDWMTNRPIAGYYPFYSWNKLSQYGTTVRVEENDPEIYAVAAKGPSGKLRIFICRYTDDSNEVYSSEVRIKIEGMSGEDATVHLTDTHYLYTEWPPTIDNDGAVHILLEPRSFALIEL